MAAAPGILPGVEMQQRSCGCSADVPGRDVVAAHTWLQRRILPGVEMQWRSGGCSADVPGHEVVVARARLQCRVFRRA
jgi:hypothetical protein